jgi:hypothetical protein
MSLINFYNPFILVNNFTLRTETSVYRDRANQSNRFGMFGMDFSSKLTWILFIISHEFITESLRHFIRVMNPCDIINKIHVSFDEKSIPNQRFYISNGWARSLSTDVSGRGLKLLTSMNGL